ncbi:hypothetical protein [Micromonospora sp. NBC_01813]|uniref:hypothetical protein n=1 Tax=Micromonospora sp. NBC_01813 TaxID=2975988 RepID=UPI002DD85DCF|nr:hypothetical protein [Micromonospora sp. NBC_01813]WSA08781.1 hypothetical protein OG958_32225 [Micromonospora sp. NBC_01813]
MVEDRLADAADARWLLDEADPGDWSGPALTALAGSRGWRPVDAAAADPSAASPPDGAGRGECRLVPFGEAAARYSGGREYREIAVPAAVDPSPVDHRTAARTFRQVRDSMVAALGPADAFGSHGPHGPWFDPVPRWGAPFLRWRRPGSRVLELRAAPVGADLVLQPVEPYEAWRADTHEWSELGDVGGFVGERLVPNNEGLFTPGVPRVTTWKQWQALIPGYLARLPAETLALGEHVDLYLFGGSTPRLRIISSPDGELCLKADLRTPDDPVLAGWCRSTDQSMSWRYDAGGAGKVDADQLARLIVATLRAEKVRSLSQLVVVRDQGMHWAHFGFFMR